jgi:hypothetical protein
VISLDELVELALLRILQLVEERMIVDEVVIVEVYEETSDWLMVRLMRFKL